MTMPNILLTPVGLSTVTVPSKYRVDDILDLNDITLKAFAEILHVPEAKRYQVIYSLALNGLLIISMTDDLSTGFQKLSLTGSEFEILDWVQKKRQVLMAMDELIVSEGTSFRIPRYELTFTGKRSKLFYLLENLLAKSKNKETVNFFENSFHILPAKFIGGTERINDYEAFRSKIRSVIETNFSINESVIEQTFNLIDQVYFSELLKYRLQAAGKRVRFRVSSQMNRTVGSMADKFREREYVITISNRLSQVLGDKLSSGIRVNGPVDAFIVTLQHEITHLIVHLEMDRLGITSADLTDPGKILPINADAFKSHGIIFKDIGERFFGLTERTHRLFEEENDSDPTAISSVTSSQLIVGTRVYFDTRPKRGNNAGERVFGTITKLNPKRAVVQTENSERGYTVPYEMLHLA